jgi:hypothetical protein
MTHPKQTNFGNNVCFIARFMGCLRPPTGEMRARENLSHKNIALTTQLRGRYKLQCYVHDSVT